MANGFYAIFEGNDGAGKTTTMQAVAERLEELKIAPRVHRTSHPGSTPLGSHLRTLIKYPTKIHSQITIDNLSRQMLYMVDTVAFIRQILEPALEAGDIVLADRSSFISAIVYATADGLNLDEIERLFNLITPPRANRLYVLSCPWELGKQRLASRQDRLDHYDNKPNDFLQKVEGLYNQIITGPPERTLLVGRSVNVSDVIFVDATLPFTDVVDVIVKDILKRMRSVGTIRQ